MTDVYSLGQWCFCVQGREEVLSKAHRTFVLRTYFLPVTYDVQCGVVQGSLWA